MMKKIGLFFTATLISICMTGQQKNNIISGDLIIFHAGSLSVPLKEIAARFRVFHPEVNILLESAGSVASARKITDLNRPCDILASSDYGVIGMTLLLPPARI